MCLLPVCLNWPGFPVFACERSRLSARLGSLPSKKYKSKAGCCCRRKPCHQRALGFCSKMVSLGKGEDGQGGMCFLRRASFQGVLGLVPLAHVLGSEDCHPGGPLEQSHRGETGRSEVEVW